MTVDILQRSTLVLKNGGQNTIQYNKKDKICQTATWDQVINVGIEQTLLLRYHTPHNSLSVLRKKLITKPGFNK